MILVVPTRNNPAALATMLGSFLAVTHDTSENSAFKHTLFLADGSNEPVITHPHLNRLLTRFDLHYRHFLNPQVNVQRIHGITQAAKMFGEGSNIILSDDDHIFVSDPLKAVLDFDKDSKAKAYFGVCVDILNDKGYSDFSMHTKEGGHHSFPEQGICIGTRECPELKEFSANPGLLICRPSSALNALCNLHNMLPETPAIADDAWARSLASPPLIHTRLAAMHVGNSNRWWNNWKIKHTAVDLALEKAK